MNTKRRLSDDLSNDSEILSEKRFVKLYKEELESIEKQIHDLKKLDQKDFDIKPEVEDKARLYYRTFAREFYDVCEGRVSDEEFFDLWEREEELKAGLNSINSLEGEQKQLEKELVHANEDETMMNGKIKAAQEKRRNKKALFISFLCMRSERWIFISFLDECQRLSVAVECRSSDHIIASCDFISVTEESW